jgi:hypothetical protein
MTQVKRKKRAVELEGVVEKKNEMKYTRELLGSMYKFKVQ